MVIINIIVFNHSLLGTLGNLKHDQLGRVVVMLFFVICYQAHRHHLHLPILYNVNNIQYNYGVGGTKLFYPHKESFS